MFFLIIGFIVFGILVFAFVAGAIFYKHMFLRPKDNSSINKQVITTALVDLQQSVPADKIQGVKMQAGGNLASHLNDKKIMVPLLQAKLKWITQYEQGSLEQIKINASKNTILSGFLVLPKKPPKYIAILLHGYTDSALGMAYLAEEYLKQNCGVLAIDAIAHGFSSGKYISMGYKEAKTLSLWIKEINQRIQDFPQKPKLILHGVSMGGAAVIQSLANKNLASQTDFIAAAVADCSFASFKEQLASQINSFLGKNLFQQGISSMLIFGMSVINFFLNGFFFYKNSPKKALMKRQKMPTCNIPLVIFHGIEDAFVSSKVTKTLENAANGNINVNLVENAPHIGSFFYESTKYMQIIFESIKQ